jgi:YggT family protein
MFSIKQVLNYAVSVMMLVIFASVVISWLRQFRVRIPHYNPVVRAVEETADLMLRPIRRHLPAAGGGLDFSPMIAILILYMLQAVIARL